MPDKKATFQGIMLEGADSREHRDCSSWPLRFAQTMPCMGQLWHFWRRLITTIHSLKHLKPHLNFQFLCAYPSRSAGSRAWRDGVRKRPWESAEPGCSAEQLTWASLLDRQKMFLCCQSKSLSGGVWNEQMEIYSLKIFTCHMNLPWLHQSYTVLHLITQARTQPSRHT